MGEREVENSGRSGDAESSPWLPKQAAAPVTPQAPAPERNEPGAWLKELPAGEAAAPIRPATPPPDETPAHSRWQRRKRAEAPAAAPDTPGPPQDLSHLEERLMRAEQRVMAAVEAEAATKAKALDAALERIASQEAALAELRAELAETEKRNGTRLEALADSQRKTIDAEVERINHSIDTEVGAHQVALDAAGERAAALKAAVEAVREELATARAEDRAAFEEAIAQQGATLRDEQDRQRTLAEERRRADQLSQSEALARTREAFEGEQGRARDVVDAEILRIQEQYGREHSALTDTLRALMGRTEDLERRLGQVNAPLLAKIAELERKLGEVDRPLLARIDELDARIDEVDRHARMGDELAKALNRYEDQHRAEPETGEDGRVDLNAASFEDLRALGLSVTQAARLVAHRDSRGGFSTREDLTGLPGLPEDLLTSLLERTRI